MQGADIPPLAWVAFGGAWIVGLTLFACLFLITRRLGVSWQKHFGGYSLSSTDTSRIGRMLFGREAPPADAKVESLLWLVRGCWLAMTVLIISFALLLAGVA
ncbi:hypothetical protein [Brevundimonas sp.]|uniref:hypothetical protein n=1 Tax=Brevundimonas sp. TaxID=1871086 RepID=UPI0040335806